MDKRIAASIGFPYSPTGNGPNSFNCWSFVRFVLDEPSLPDANASTQAGNIAEISKWRGKFLELNEPEPYCIVLLGKLGVMSHVGIWHPTGVVFHCMEGSGVVGHRLEHIRILGYDTKAFYKWVTDDKANSKERSASGSHPYP